MGCELGCGVVGSPKDGGQDEGDFRQYRRPLVLAVGHEAGFYALTTVDVSDTRRSAQATFVVAGQRVTLNLLPYRDVYPASRTFIEG